MSANFSTCSGNGFTQSFQQVAGFSTTPQPLLSLLINLYIYYSSTETGGPADSVESSGGSMPDPDERDEHEAGSGGIQLHAHIAAGQEELEGDGGLSGQQGALLPGLGGEVEELTQQGVPDVGW